MPLCNFRYFLRDVFAPLVLAHVPVLALVILAKNPHDAIFFYVEGIILLIAATICVDAIEIHRHNAGVRWYHAALFYVNIAVFIISIGAFCFYTVACLTSFFDIQWRFFSPRDATPDWDYAMWAFRLSAGAVILAFVFHFFGSILVRAETFDQNENGNEHN